MPARVHGFTKGRDDLDEACGLEDTTALSNALENRVLPWLDGLLGTLELWQNSFLLGSCAR